MKASDGTDEAKRRAGESASGQVENGMVVGLGTGSTAAHAIRALGEKVAAGMEIQGVPTSYQSRTLAREVGIPLCTLEAARPDIAIDGADQLQLDGALVKGGGAAHAREKIVDTSAPRCLIVADDTKLTDTLDHPIPVEVLPDAVPTVEQAIHERDGDPTVRTAQRKDGPVVTDNGNLVLDCAFGPIETPETLAASLSAIPGVVEHGLFIGVATELHIGSNDGVSIHSV
ncbi:ribose-5-phosphate isomerase RpiA [Halocatena pleomorpha]|uniref:Ribose-5-phosphate isomerase A n=1 Tax=Halocatena pleomorpha TaxID=1785090 RepID=A0A3P3R5D0_9EURY|nr:ribose-5-phosphate isomerase RpiA [Halocatena pleomorpha]RRJ28564.1 ribose-5-phosphate isomerase RpiA [Halocatena pleomorpha]